MSASLPIASPAQVWRAAGGDVRADGRVFVVVVLLNVFAAGAGLVAPWLLGRIIDTVRTSSGLKAVATVDRLALIIVVFTLVQIVLSRYALYMSTRFGERASARIRERFLGRALGMPAATVEHASRGDLVTRGTADVNMVSGTLRSIVPAVFIALVQAFLIIGAVLFLDPLLGLCGLAYLAVWVVLRWYLRRARDAYLAEGAANAGLTEVLTTTVAGARTIEALRLQGRRTEALAAAIEVARRSRLRTLWLRTVLFPTVDISYMLPLVSVLLVGGVLYNHGFVSLGTVVAAAVYFRQLIQPLDAILMWVERLQASSASYARVEGLAFTPQAETHTSAEPADDRIEVTDVSYAYEHGPDVLHGVNLHVRPGERLAVVGPSGAGKSTLGRLLAGVDRPRTGAVTVGGVAVASLAPDRLRRQVVLVTQEHHVFQDTVRGNLTIVRPNATEAQLRDALAAVGATWVDDLPDGLDTALGNEEHQLDGAQAQQLALARVVLANPHTLVLDEATALLDPTTARNTERALAAVLQGRTVIAIAHRLQTAHDADRIAVMDAGRTTELGGHDELVRKGGAYAALWRSWHGD
jgi:ATP-binding cassette subfamily C protein